MPALPNVLGNALSQAHETLVDAGFTNHIHVDQNGQPVTLDGSGEKKVRKTAPAPGTDVPLDSEIRVVVEAHQEFDG